MLIHLITGKRQLRELKTWVQILSVSRIWLDFLLPYKATELVQALKDGSSLPIQMHTHYTSGVASMTYLKAVEAGADIIDTAMSPFSMGTSQPATEVMVETFKGTQYDTGLDQNLLAEIADYFQPMREEALKSGLMNTKVLGVNIKTLLYQVPWNAF